MVSGQGGNRGPRSSAAVVTVELVVAMGILVSVMLPLGYSIIVEQRLVRSYYFRALALELVDGEMEVLMAGEWRAYSPGRQPYPAPTHAATNLPPGQLVLTIEPKELRLEWQPAKPGNGGVVTRVARLPAPAHPQAEEEK